MPVVGLGFIRGAYNCECKEGYYFPILDAQIKSFNGTIIENYFSQVESSNSFSLNITKLLGSSLNSSELNTVGVANAYLSQYECLHCAEGCDTCVDNSPCLYSYVNEVRAVLLIIAVFMLALVILVSLVVQVFKSRTVGIKSNVYVKVSPGRPPGHCRF